MAGQVTVGLRLFSRHNSEARHGPTSALPRQVPKVKSAVLTITFPSLPPVDVTERFLGQTEADLGAGSFPGAEKNALFSCALYHTYCARLRMW